MSKDKVFKEVREASDFKFGNEVVTVFDDMVSRSVPYYEEIQRMIAEVGKDFAKADTNLYDLGCSTGASLLLLDKSIDEKVTLVGLDDSKEMLKKCDEKLKKSGIKRAYDLKVADLNRGVTVENASFVNLCLTLQFIRPLNREKLIQDTYKGMNKGGCLMLTEKVLGENSLFNRLFIKYYYDMKRRHNYSDMEIAQKREALENVLIPYTMNENIALLKKCGFKQVDVFFKWYNFSGILAVK